MAERSKDHVHRLIRSMSKAEKRYFKLHIRRYEHAGSNNHELLFDAFSAMDHYDEEALIAHFAGHAFTKRFAITKRRLYEVVLRALCAYHSESSAEVRVRRMLHQVEVLYQRALYTDAAKMLSSVRKQAEEHHLHTVLLDVLDRERRLMERGNYKGVKQEHLEGLRDRSAALRNQVRELEELWHLKSEVMLMLYHESGATGPDIDARLEAFLGQASMHAPHTGSPRAGFLRNHILSAAAYARGDMEACRDALERNVSAFEAHRTVFKDEANLMFAMLSNLVHVHLRLGDRTRAMELLKRLRTMPADWEIPETEDMELKLFGTCASLELDIHVRGGEFAKAVELLPMVERGMERHAEGLGPMRRALLLYQLAYASLGNGDPREARRWCSRLLNDDAVGEFTEIMRAARYMDLVLRAELEHDRTLTAALRSAERYFAGSGDIRRFDKLLIDVVRRYSKHRKDPSGAKALEVFLEGVRAIEHDPKERAVFEHFDPIAWAESKLSGRSFAEVVQERARGLGRAA